MLRWHNFLLTQSHRHQVRVWIHIPRCVRICQFIFRSMWCWLFYVTKSVEWNFFYIVCLVFLPSAALPYPSLCHVNFVLSFDIGYLFARLINETFVCIQLNVSIPIALCLCRYMLSSYTSNVFTYIRTFIYSHFDIFINSLDSNRIFSFSLHCGFLLLIFFPFSRFLRFDSILKYPMPAE